MVVSIADFRGGGREEEEEEKGVNSKVNEIIKDYNEYNWKVG